MAPDADPIGRVEGTGDARAALRGRAPARAPAGPGDAAGRLVGRSASTKALFSDRGYLDPVRILSGREAHRWHRELSAQGARAVPLDWNKGWAATSRAYYSASCHPRIVSVVAELLGPDFLLWGARLVSKGPGASHDWHSDLESAGARSGTVSVWLALRDCGRESSLSVLSGSHRIGRTVQQVRSERRVAHAAEDSGQVLRWAREHVPDGRVVVAECADGDALFFDGRLWHGSHNTSPLVRSALLLQYATPDTPIRMPSSHGWPYRGLDHPRPPCVMIRGRDDEGVNRLVNAPVAPGAPHAPQLTTQAREPDVPVLADAEHWQPVPVFSGRTAGLKGLSCHVSVLRAGHRPHAPHRHDEEEILMILEGEADVVLPDLDEGMRRQRLREGDCVYYPAQFAHTIEGIGDPPVSYLMLKWTADPSNGGPAAAHRRWTLDRVGNVDAERGFGHRILFAEPTGWLHRLQSHTTAMRPGAGYEPHVDSYDVVMVVLEGAVSSIGQTLSRHGVFFYAAGESHGARNPGRETAHYAVFELHARPGAFDARSRPAALVRKITDRRRWRAFLSHRLRRLRARLPR